MTQSLVCGSISSGSRQFSLNFLVFIDWFYLFLLTFYGELGTGCYPLKNLLVKTVSMKDFPLIFLDEQDYQMLISFRIDALYCLSKTSTRVVVMKLKQCDMVGMQNHARMNLSLLIHCHIVSKTTVVCVLVHSIIFLFPIRLKKCC